MTTKHSPLTTMNALGRALIALAILMRVIVPVGFMISPQAAMAGLTPIVLCTSDGDITAYMDQSGAIVSKTDKSPHQNDKSHTDAPCTFSGHHSGFTFDDIVLAIPLVEQFGRSDLNIPSFVQPGLGLAAPPPPKTGPPIHV